MAAKSKRVLSDEEVAKLSNEQFGQYLSGEWHPDDDKVAPEPEKKNQQFRPVNLRDYHRRAKEIHQ